MFKFWKPASSIPLLTGKIVVAPLKESMDYYQRLDVAKIEVDLLKTLAGNNLTKAEVKYWKLVKSKLVLVQTEMKKLVRIVYPPFLFLKKRRGF